MCMTSARRTTDNVAVKYMGYMENRNFIFMYFFLKCQKIIRIYES